MRNLLGAAPSRAHRPCPPLTRFGLPSSPMPPFLRRGPLVPEHSSPSSDLSAPRPRPRQRPLPPCNSGALRRTALRSIAHPSPPPCIPCAQCPRRAPPRPSGQRPRAPARPQRPGTRETPSHPLPRTEPGAGPAASEEQLSAPQKGRRAWSVEPV